MYKFMIGTFAILGWAFYVMSGGSDFVPQERMATTDPAEADPAPIESDPVQTAAQDDEPAEIVEAGDDTVAVDQVAVTTDTDTDSAVVTQTSATAEPVEQGTVTAPQTPGSSTDIVTTEDPLFTSLSEGDDALPTANPIREVSARAVNMRDGPGTDFSVIDTLPQGTQAEVVAADGTGWVRVFIPGTGMTGWMAERLLTGS